MNYFELYEFPVSFNLDAVLLKKKFYDLSKHYHPDFYANESEEKQLEILELSTQINKAYQVLADLQKRIEYVLTLNQLLSDEGKYQLPQDFLMEMMEVNEALMELDLEPDAAGSSICNGLESNFVGSIAADQKERIKQQPRKIPPIIPVNFFNTSAVEAPKRAFADSPPIEAPNPIDLLSWMSTEKQVIKQTNTKRIKKK